MIRNEQAAYKNMATENSANNTSLYYAQWTLYQTTYMELQNYLLFNLFYIV